MGCSSTPPVALTLGRGCLCCHFDAQLTAPTSLSRDLPSALHRVFRRFPLFTCCATRGKTPVFSQFLHCLPLQKSCYWEARYLLSCYSLLHHRPRAKATGGVLLQPNRIAARI